MRSAAAWLNPLTSALPKCAIPRRVQSTSLAKSLLPDSFCCPERHGEHPRGQQASVVAQQAMRAAGASCPPVISYSISAMSSTMSALPMTGRKKRSVMRVGGIDFKVEAISKMRAKRPWSSGCRGCRTS